MRDCGGRRCQKQRSDILRSHREVVENLDVSSGGFLRTKTSMERTPKTSVHSKTRFVSGLDLNSKEIFFFLSVSFHIS